MGNKAIFYIGIAFISVAVLKALFTMLSFKTIDIWSILFALGCILTSIGLGRTKLKPWNKIGDSVKHIQKNMPV